MTKNNNIFDYIKIIGISIFVILIQYFCVNYCILGETDVQINKGSMGLLYFGGVLIECCFDIIAVSLYMVSIICETIILTCDLFNGLMDNLDILICRASKRERIYEIFIRNVIKRNSILIIFEYLLFLLIERSPAVSDIKYVVMHFILIICLELIYFIFGFFFKNRYGYIWMLIIYFLPILFVGFLYFKGSDAWNIGKYFLLHNGMATWYTGITVIYQEYEMEWNTVVLSSSGNAIHMLIEIILCISLLYIGKFIFRKMQII